MAQDHDYSRPSESHAPAGMISDAQQMLKDGRELMERAKAMLDRAEPMVAKLENNWLLRWFI